PPPPELTVQSTAPAERPSSAASFELPKLDIPLGMTGGPFLGQLAAAGSAVDGTRNAELVPLVRLAPQYPRQAARMGISGWVRLRVVVNPDGTVRDARAIDAEPRGLFEAAAVTAAMRGKFRPRIVDGEAVESEGEYTVRFSLGG